MGWWIVAAVVVAVVTIIAIRPYWRDVVDYHNTNEKNELVALVANHLKLAFFRVDMSVGPGRLNSVVWRDPYLLGYAGGFGTCLCKTYEPHFTAEQSGEVTFAAVRLVDHANGDRTVKLMIRLLETQDGLFLNGFKHGAKVAATDPVFAHDMMLEYMDKHRSLAYAA